MHLYFDEVSVGFIFECLKTGFLLSIFFLLPFPFLVILGIQFAFMHWINVKND